MLGDDNCWSVGGQGGDVSNGIVEGNVPLVRGGRRVRRDGHVGDVHEELKLGGNRGDCRNGIAIGRAGDGSSGLLAHE